jgi:hypothetical protein
LPLPPYLHKNALAATPLLPGITHDRFADILAAHQIAIACDDEAAGRRETPMLLELVVNLLARLYPRIALVGRGTKAAGLMEHMGALAHAINPDVELTAPDNTAISVSIGGTTPVSDRFTIYASSENWLTRISTAPLPPPADTTNPVGAAGAACLAAANIFRHVFRDLLPEAHPDTDLTLSLFDDKQFGVNPALSKRIALHDEHLVGLGAIGNAVVWTLARTVGITGALHLIDPEFVDDTNPQRYVLTTVHSVETRKTDLAVAALTGTGITAVPHHMTWGAYVAAHPNRRFLHVSAAVDSAEVRCAIQSVLPRTITNAWTQHGDLGISRHPDFLGAACVACIYIPREDEKSEATLVAEALGLPSDYELVKTLLHTNASLDQPVLELVARRNGASVADLLPFHGQTLRALYRNGVCAGLPLFTQAGRSDSLVVPLAFQSAFAGVLLAAELLITAAGIERTPLTITSLDLLRPIPQSFSRPIAKHEAGNCICQDEDYRAVYRAKYLETSHT